MAELPSGADEILSTLDRSLILRNFNRDQMGMEDMSSKSGLEKLCGIGTRVYKPTGESRPVVDFYASYFRRVIRTFEETKVAERYGISLNQAMAMPVDRWYEVEKQATLMMTREPADPIERVGNLIEKLVDALTTRSVM